MDRSFLSNFGVLNDNSSSVSAVGTVGNELVGVTIPSENGCCVLCGDEQILWRTDLSFEELFEYRLDIQLSTFLRSE